MCLFATTFTRLFRAAIIEFEYVFARMSASDLVVRRMPGEVHQREANASERRYINIARTLAGGE